METKYNLSSVLVDSTRDIVVCNNFCLLCFESKTGLKVLHVFDTTESSAREYMKYGCRTVNIKTCRHGKPIKFVNIPDSNKRQSKKTGSKKSQGDPETMAINLLNSRERLDIMANSPIPPQLSN